MHRVGFEPTQLTLPDLKSGSLDPSDIDALKTLLAIILQHINIYTLYCFINIKYFFVYIFKYYNITLYNGFTNMLFRSIF